MDKTNWMKVHKDLGCPGCRYCDNAALFESSCCTYPGKLKVDDNTGKCLTRKAKNTNRFSYNSEMIHQERLKAFRRITKAFGVEIPDPFEKFDQENHSFYNIYYRKEFIGRENREFQEKDASYEDIMGRDYIYLASFWAPKDTTLDEIFSIMQGERWSPEGEARDLIRWLGLQHTSMSVGDIIEDAETGCYYEVAGVGFNNLTYGWKTTIKNTKI